MAHLQATQKRKKRHSKKRSGLGVLLVVVLVSLALIGVGIWLLLQTLLPGRASDTLALDAAFQVENLDPDARIGRLSAGQPREAKPGEALFLYGIEEAPVFSSTGKGDILIENAPSNAYLMVLEITRAGEDTLLYQSKYIAPNQYVKTVQLSPAPAPGTFDATAYINVVDAKTKKVVDILEHPLTITVEK